MGVKKELFTIADKIDPEMWSKLDTANAGLAKIVDIPLDQIAVNEKNFYDTSNVKELADSISLNGLIEPIIVIPAEGERKYKIISGHRRFNAFSQLHEDDPEKYAVIPAIVRAPVNEIVEELLLIDANRATRVMSSADTAKQAERVTELFAQLKESGAIEIPGRLRDAVAKAMDISTSRLARLKVIREKLIPTYMDAFESGKLNESVAYEIARLYPLQQEKLSQIVKDPNKLTCYDVPNYGKRLNIYFGPELKCEKVRDPKLQTPTYCTHGEKMWEVSKVKSLYGMCSECCANCCNKTGCKSVCPVIAPDVEKVKLERAERENESKVLRAKQQADAENHVVLFWSRAKAARESSGLSAEEAFIKINAECRARNCWLSIDDHKELIEQENGASNDPEADEFWRDDDTPNDFDSILAFADVYGCSVDYLLGQIDNPTPCTAPDGWRSLTKNPPAEEQHIITLKRQPTRELRVGQAIYREGKLFSDQKGFDTVEVPNELVIGWMPFPEVP